MQRIEIADRLVGAGRPVFVIAEAGSNHDRDFNQAKELITLAQQAGADAVKFQVFQADQIVARSKVKPEYLDQIVGKNTSMHEVFQKLELPRAWLRDLATYAAEVGIIFLATPFLTTGFFSTFLSFGAAGFTTLAGVDLATFVFVVFAINMLN